MKKPNKKASIIKIRKSLDDDSVILQILEQYSMMIKAISFNQNQMSKRHKYELKLIDDTLKRNDYSS